ncbi:MAG: GIY-YIG nuclease family protein [Candidatus Pacebacteria bacterium]|nr:GIY-YIG nuclease family protein [Candidatus Paceibacterota bacterium]
MFYVYVIERTKDDYLYIGYTADLRRRFKEHSNGQKCRLVYYEAYFDKKTAQNREVKLKQFGGAWRSLKKRIEGN